MLMYTLGFISCAALMFFAGKEMKALGERLRTRLKDLF